MLARIFGGSYGTPPRPDLALNDVAACLPDRERAAAALAELQRLERLELVDMYLPAGWGVSGERRFNVWLDHRLRPPHGERLTLAAWCQRWLADRAPAPDGDNGGAA